MIINRNIRFFVVFLFIISSLFTFLSSKSAFALEPVIIDDTRGEYPLGLHLEILEDKEKKWTIEDVTSDEFSDQFVHSKKETHNFGYTSSAYWIRFSLKNSTENLDKWLLEIGYPTIDNIELYIPKTEGNFVIKRGGDHLPLKEREVKHRNSVFHLSIAYDSNQTFYLRFSSGGTMVFPITVWTPTAFVEKDHQEQYILGIYYGILLVMFISNLFLFYLQRDVISSQKTSRISVMEVA